LLDVVVGLGSNLGDRLGCLRAAVRELSVTYDVRTRSHVYETAAVGPVQPDYLNAAIRLRASGTPMDVLRVLLAVEKQGGRERTPGVRWDARTIDLDLLWADGVVLSSAELTVPHPRLTERAFALRPFLDVAPDAIDPRTGERFVSPERGEGVRVTDFVL
jgi:2-amino-4-hydroxy-6-hydroxymethyldihydropteridine diphosphokinase